MTTSKGTVSGEWVQSGSLEEARLRGLIYARVLTVERNEYSLVIRFSNGAVLTVAGGGQDGSCLGVEVRREL